MELNFDCLLFFIRFGYLLTSERYNINLTPYNIAGFIQPTSGSNIPVDYSKNLHLRKKSDLFLKKRENLANLVNKIKKIKNNRLTKEKLFFIGQQVNNLESEVLKNKDFFRIDADEQSLNTNPPTLEISKERPNKINLPKKPVQDTESRAKNKKRLFEKNLKKISKSQKFLTKEIYKDLLNPKSGYSIENIKIAVSKSIKSLYLPLNFMGTHQSNNSIENSFDQESLLMCDDDAQILNLFFEVNNADPMFRNTLLTFVNNELQSIKINHNTKDKIISAGDAQLNHHKIELDESIYENINLKKEYLPLIFIIPESIYIFTQFLDKENIQNFMNNNHDPAKRIMIKSNFQKFRKLYRKSLLLIWKELDEVEKRGNSDSECLLSSGIFIYELLFRETRKRSPLMFKISKMRTYLHGVFDYLMNNPQRFPHYDIYKKIKRDRAFYFSLGSHLFHFARYFKTYTPFPISHLNEYLKITSLSSENKHESEVIEKEQERLRKILIDRSSKLYLYDANLKELNEFLDVFEKNILKNKNVLVMESDQEQCAGSSFLLAKTVKNTKIADIKYRIDCRKDLNLYFIYLNYLVLKTFFQ